MTVTAELFENLQKRNSIIIEAVKTRAASVCPDALDMIGVTGSFQSGDAHPYSDLDLLIIINDSAGYALSECFVLGDGEEAVGFDIYCHTWEQMEVMADYTSPYVSKLLCADVMYTRTDAVKTRYDSLRQRLETVMAEPFSRRRAAVIDGYLSHAARALGEMFLATDPGEVRAWAASVLSDTESAVLLANGDYVRHGVRGIPSQLAALDLLPQDYPTLHRAVTDAAGADGLRSAARELLSCVRGWFDTLCQQQCPKPVPDGNALAGTCEEMVSNWYQKLRRAAGENDRYLSMMSCAACAGMLGELSAEYALPPLPSVMENGEAWDCGAAVGAFARANGALCAFRAEHGTPMRRYRSAEAFAAAYTEAVGSGDGQNTQ